MFPGCFQDLASRILSGFCRDLISKTLSGSPRISLEGFLRRLSRILQGFHFKDSSRISSGSHFFQDLFRIAFQPGSHLQGFFQEFIEGVHQDRIQRIPPATRLATSQEATPPALLIHRLHPTQHGTGFFNPSLEGRAVASHLLIPSPSRPLPTEGPHTDTHTHVPRL